MKQTKIWVILYSALFIIGCGAFLLLKNTGTAGTIADIWVNGELYETINLDAVTIPYNLKVESEYGYNVVHVEHGAISIIESDCPDQICVDQGTITDSAIPIVCLPHRLVIEIRGEP